MMAGDLEQSGKRTQIERQRLYTERIFGVHELPRRLCGVTGPGADWDGLRQAVLGCTKCRLGRVRTRAVFGEGNPKAELLFVGEAPGFDEDREGRPFVGKAGQLLTKIIQAMGLGREDVFIANCLKCRPPQNRNPLPDEIASCRPYLAAQIEHIKPKIICALGKFAAQTLLETDAPISRLRGRFHEFKGMKIMPTFHPAYLLRNPADKKLAWEDIQLIMAELGLKNKRAEAASPGTP